MSEVTKACLRDKGIKSWFPIQSHCFQPIFEGKNILARDITGSGKTLAFAAPIVDQLRVQGDIGNGKIKALVLAPTRELAQQIAGVFMSLMGTEDEFKVLCTFGGMGMERQGDALRSGVDIVVGTTGRTLDFVNRGDLVL